MEKMLRIEVERRRLGMKKTDLAIASGLSDVLVTKLTKGSMPPYPKYRTALAAALEWDGDPMELFEEVSEDGDEELSPGSK